MLSPRQLCTKNNSRVFFFFPSGSRAVACNRRYRTSAFIIPKTISAHSITAGSATDVRSRTEGTMADVNRRGTGLFQGWRSRERYRDRGQNVWNNESGHQQLWSHPLSPLLRRAASRKMPFRWKMPSAPHSTGHTKVLPRLSCTGTIRQGLIM